MFYEIDSSGIMLRALPGYFAGFKEDLADVDDSILSDVQRDYISIPDERIVEVSEEEHRLLECKAEARVLLSQRCRTERAAILDDVKILNVLTGATAGYPSYLTAANVAAFIETYKKIYHSAAAEIAEADTVESVVAIVAGLRFPTEAEILAQMEG
jgi:flagellar motility protein MotE (MotC chaperone)